LETPKITCGSWRIWLNEGFATYLHRWLLKILGDAAFVADKALYDDVLLPHKLVEQFT
jgi:aminopeptidase N